MGWGEVGGGLDRQEEEPGTGALAAGRPSRAGRTLPRLYSIPGPGGAPPAIPPGKVGGAAPPALGRGWKGKGAGGGAGEGEVRPALGGSRAPPCGQRGSLRTPGSGNSG